MIVESQFEFITKFRQSDHGCDDAESPESLLWSYNEDTEQICLTARVCCSFSFFFCLIWRKLPIEELPSFTGYGSFSRKFLGGGGGSDENLRNLEDIRLYRASLLSF